VTLCGKRAFKEIRRVNVHLNVKTKRLEEKKEVKEIEKKSV
jgi:hypothetical protein